MAPHVLHSIVYSLEPCATFIHSTLNRWTLRESSSVLKIYIPPMENLHEILVVWRRIDREMRVSW